MNNYYYKTNINLFNLLWELEAAQHSVYVNPVVNCGRFVLKKLHHAMLDKDQQCFPHLNNNKGFI